MCHKLPDIYAATVTERRVKHVLVLFAVASGTGGTLWVGYEYVDTPSGQQTNAFTVRA